MAKSRYSNAVDLLATPTVGANTTLQSKIQATETKFSNYKATLASFGKGIAIEGLDNALASSVLGALLVGQRKAANRMACASSSDAAYAMWQDERAKGKLYLADNLSATSIPAGEGTKDAYFVWLAKGTEARARAHEMVSLIDAGASEEEVFHIHQHIIMEYQTALHAVETLVVLQKHLTK